MTAETETRTMLIELAALIAPLLGEGWTAGNGTNRWGEPAHWVAIAHTEGYALHLTTEYRKPGRLVISGNWPEMETEANHRCVYPSMVPGLNDTDRGSITVALDRSTATIGGEIQRRLLPGYVAAWTQCKAYADEWDRKARAREANIARFAALLGVPVNQYRKGHLTRYRGTGYFSIDVEVYHDQVRLDIQSVPLDEAEAIIKQLLAA